MTSDERLKQAMWEGDLDWLNEHYRCICCCDEHTFETCPARQWNGCRGQYTMTSAEQESWQKHYEKAHGMSWQDFYGYGDTDE